MFRYLPLFILLACDFVADDLPVSSPPPPETHVEDTGISCPDTCGAIEPPAPVNNSHCSCDPNGPDTCGLGLDCVPWEGGGRCLAKCFGANELGGGYVTKCDDGKVACDYSPFGYPGPSYCPACATCTPVNPLSLVCQ